LPKIVVFEDGLPKRGEKARGASIWPEAQTGFPKSSGENDQNISSRRTGNLRRGKKTRVINKKWKLTDGS